MGHKEICAAGAMLLMATLAACGNSGFTVKGTLDLTSIDGIQGDGEDAGASCHGQSGYDDIDEGAQVVIKDGDSKRIAVGSLGAGTLMTSITDAETPRCEFTFKVKDVPDKGSIYTIAIGNRDDYTFKKSEASSLALSLGN